jgi:hypothetical protein
MLIWVGVRIKEKVVVGTHPKGRVPPLRKAKEAGLLLDLEWIMVRVL